MNIIKKLLNEIEINEKPAGVKIEFKHIGKKYQGRAEYTLNDINLTINVGEFCAILGPSGCGKTTLLRMIAGLSSITKGDLLFDNRRVNDLEPSDRDIAMVFQSYALYPHMNVYKNISFGLENQKIRKDIIDERVKNTSKILRISNRLYDKPKDLSGGQRQRVAIARAIVRKPSIFLMDEPLSNLDAKLRESTRREIVQIHKMLGSTTIYVTHDQIEAMTMSDKIILMNDLKIQQIGTAYEIYSNPINLFVAKFIGSPTMNIFEGYIKGNFFVSSFDETFKLLLDCYKIPKEFENKKLLIGIRSEDIIHTGQKYDIKLKVESVEFLGKEKIIIATNKISHETILAVVPNWVNINSSAIENFVIKRDNIYFFEIESELAINFEVIKHLDMYEL